MKTTTNLLYLGLNQLPNKTNPANPYFTLAVLDGDDSIKFFINGDLYNKLLGYTSRAELKRLEPLEVELNIYRNTSGGCSVACSNAFLVKKPEKK